MKKILIVLSILSVLTELPLMAESNKKEFVRGGQFKDLILPIPIIDGLESEGLWGGKNVIPRDKDNGIEDNVWCYWGGNAIKGADGKYHIAICRWLENTGHNGWFESEVAHCVSDNPFGPYKVTRQIIEKAHNPEVQPLPNGKFALHTSSEEVFIADSMSGDWKYLGKMKMEPRGFCPPRLGSNLTTAMRPDNSIILMTKGGNIAISKGDILGTYNMVSIGNFKRNSGYAEDPVIWHSRHQYHCIYNHAQDRKSGYMRSIDGINWKNEDGLPYDVSSTFYSDGSKNEWYKFERAKVVQDEIGRAEFLSLAVIDIPKSQDKGNDNHSSKHMIMPLTKEKLISFVSDKKITAKTKKIAIKIEAEEGFYPQTDIKLESLRFGSDSKVNYGEGCVAYDTQNEGDDLIVIFKGNNGLNRFDYDFKLIGETKNGDLIIGYALLPGESHTAATLVSIPVISEIKGNTKELTAIIENSGLSTSEPTKAILHENSKDYGWRVVDKFDIPAIKPYETFAYKAVLNEVSSDKREYRVEILNQKSYYSNWNRVDESHPSVQFKGDWTATEGNQYYMGSEQTTDKIGGSVSFSFKGVRAAVYGNLENRMGSFEVYIDGEYVENIRLSWGGPNSKIYQTDMLEYGEHTIELRAAKYEKSSIVSIDGFAFE